MWLPENDLFLDVGGPHVRPHRPYLQGDVFVDVAMSLVKRFKEDPDYRGNEGKVMAALLGHPCASYSRGTPTPIQAVAEVRRLGDAAGGRPFEPPWDTHSYLFPLPRLLGEDYVVDFRRIGTTHVSYLENHRVACLSHDGWAAFQRRYAFHAIRSELVPLEWLEETRVYWNEFDVWEHWNEQELDPPRYQEWLEEPAATGHFQGTVRRELLEYAPDAVRDDLPVAGQDHEWRRADP